jgi:glycosyltransferase involved in cell wall biosynthesis
VLTLKEDGLTRNAFRPLKVLHVIPAVAPRYGGPSIAVFSMCKAIQDAGIQTCIAATDADGKTRIPVELGREYVYQSVPCVFFSRQFSEAFKYSRPLAAWLEQNVSRFDAVHIHAVFSHSSVAAGRACRRSGVPYIVRPLGTLDPWSMNQKRIRKNLLWYTACRSLLKQSAAVHYTTHEEMTLAEESLGVSRGAVIPLGVEPFCDNQTTDSMRRPYVLILCRLHPKKNVDIVIRAFSQLSCQPEFSAWSLVIAGDGELAYTRFLRSLVTELGATERIRFTGWLDRAQKSVFLRSADLYVLISHQENLGIAVLEALSCGVPALVSEGVNLSGMIRDAGAGWVVSVDPRAVQMKLAEAMLSAPERMKRGKQGRLLVDRGFRWPVVARQLLELYSAVLAD